MMRDKILDFLKKKENYVSGEELSHHFKISRQALWKHIQELKEAGYEILAVPHLGYKLVSIPDRLFSAEISRGLNTKVIGKKIYYFESVSSTMDIAVKLGMEGSPDGTLVISETQTKGRGRLGRSWLSPKYKGVYLSLILRPKILPAQAPIITLLAAVSICEAIKRITGLEAKIKWPNDILMYQKKLGGILTELNAETDELRFAVIGLGLNVNNDKKALLTSATSLKEQKKENINRLDLLQEILRRIEANYLLFQGKGPQPIIEQWREYNITLGRRVKVISHKELREGEAIDIDIDGGLLLRQDSGLTEKIMAGDVAHCR
ncbi:MAG: biotin--[acetyl-CoA-carboxylase] ligase [Candidatus Omnitrophica bacterium]|nr:biotin--[acetyl-CoA-carboxylase] ligase [Candidatus Omnitrophota bacterium]MBI5144820.1 biotin--[acetyl-CoA-carboxylase] ligase [Candidatus Omnitrophota bacterium]